MSKLKKYKASIAAKRKEIKTFGQSVLAAGLTIGVLGVVDAKAPEAASWGPGLDVIAGGVLMVGALGMKRYRLPMAVGAVAAFATPARKKVAETAATWGS